MTKRVLITGASGFIGRQSVAPLLAHGYEAHLAVRRPSALDVLEDGTRERCRVHEIDLLDARSVARAVRGIRPSHVLHFAWHPDLETRWSSPANLDWAAATLNLATAFAAAGGRRMVVCGTCAEYDWGYETLIEDQTPLAPATLYGAAKAGAHELLRFAAPHLPLSLAWGHVFFCYGPGEPAGRLVSDVVAGLLAGRPVACSSGDQVRDYMHTEDVGRAFASLVESDFEGAVNVASGVAVRLRDLIGTAAGLIGRPDLVKLGARPPNPGEPARLVADVRRLRQEIGFCPAYDLEAGLAQTIEWYKGNIT